MPEASKKVRGIFRSTASFAHATSLFKWRKTSQSSSSGDGDAPGRVDVVEGPIEAGRVRSSAGAEGAAGTKVPDVSVASNRVATRKGGYSADFVAAQRMACIALLSAIALVLSYVETMIPLPTALPGVKLGLANVAVVVALFRFDVRTAAAVACVKVLAAGFLFGSPVMLAYSLGGTLLAFASAALLAKVPGISVVVVSMASAIFHNVGQIAVACLMLSTPAILVSLPPLAVAACITGALTGMVAAATLGVPAGTGAFAALRPSGRMFSKGEGACEGRQAHIDAAAERACASRISAKAYGVTENVQVVGLAGAGVPTGVGVLGAHAEGLVRRGALSTSGAGGMVDGNAAASATIRGASPASAHSTNAYTGAFGVYQPGDSLAHRLDARTKIAFTCAFFVAAFMANDVASFACLVAATALSLAASHMGLRAALRTLRPFAWLIALTVVTGLLFGGSGLVIATVGPFAVTEGGLVFAAESATRFCCLMLGTAALMRTTAPAQLTEGMRVLLSPLARLGVPVESMALALGMTFRFIPLFAAEFQRIKAAQESRLANFSGGVAQRLRSYALAFVPLFASAFRRADAVAFAVQSRAFGAGKRTSLRERRIAHADRAVLAVCAVLVGAAFAL